MKTIALTPGLNAYQQVFWIAAKSAIRQTAAAMIAATNNPLGGPGSNDRPQDTVAVAQSLTEFEEFLSRGLKDVVSSVQGAPSFPHIIGIANNAFEFRSTPKMVFPSRKLSSANPSDES